MGIDYKSVESSNLTDIGYDEASKTLYVKFKGGGHYSYDNVSKETYNSLMKAGSHGQHFHKHIKPHYKHKKIA